MPSESHWAIGSELVFAWQTKPNSWTNTGMFKWIIFLLSYTYKIRFFGVFFPQVLCLACCSREVTQLGKRTFQAACTKMCCQKDRAGFRVCQPVPVSNAVKLWLDAYRDGYRENKRELQDKKGMHLSFETSVYLVLLEDADLGHC